NDARTSADLVVGGVHKGWGVAMGALGTERGTTLLGDHLRIQHEVGALIAAAKAGGRAPSGALRQDLVRAWTEARIMEWNGLRLMTAIKGRGIDPTVQASVSKVFASRSHTRIGETAMRALDIAGEVAGEQYELNRLQQVFLGSRSES